VQEYELYGYSLFETFLAMKGRFWCLEDHWNRLSTSAKRFGMEHPTLDRFTQEVHAYCDETRDELIRYTLMQTGGRWASNDIGTETRLLKKSWDPAEPRPLRLYLEEGSLPARDEMRCHKTGSRMCYQSSYHGARSRGFDDCLFSDDEGYLLESSTFSLIVCIEGLWYTPPLSRGLLPGVARRFLIEEHAVTEKDLRLSDVDIFEAVVVANAVRGLKPVSALGHRMLTTELSTAFIESVGERQYT